MKKLHKMAQKEMEAAKMIAAQKKAPAAKGGNDKEGGLKLFAKREEHEKPGSDKTVALLSVSSIFFGLIGFFLARAFTSSYDLPETFKGHPVFYDRNLLSPQAQADLRAMVKEEKQFSTFTQDNAFYSQTHDHIGEAQPIGEDGKCAHPFLVPLRKSLCVLPGRIDIARHYMLTGGVDGLKEDTTILAQRTQSFARYYWSNPNGTFSHPVLQRLFDDKKFATFAASVCPKDKPVVDPFQATTVANVPGQTVPVHVDAVVFWGADRFHVPQWLLATMQFSDLFKEQFVDQIQVVAYFHNWEDKEKTRGGEFLWWEAGSDKPKSIEPLPGSGSAVDGSKVLHTARLYRPDSKPPAIDKSATNILRHVPDSNTWELVANDKKLTSYTEDDLRFSVVYRARCFRDEAEKQRFYNQRRPEDMMPLETILDRLITNAVEKKLTRISVEEFKNLDRLTMALELLDCYVKLPSSPTAWFGANYCALRSYFIPKAQPFIAWIFRAIGCGNP